MKAISKKVFITTDGDEFDEFDEAKVKELADLLYDNCDIDTKILERISQIIFDNFDKISDIVNMVEPEISNGE